NPYRDGEASLYYILILRPFEAYNSSILNMNSSAKSASGSFKIKIPTKRTSASTFDQTKRRRKGQEEEAEVRVEEQFILRLQIPEEAREKFREQVRNRHYVDDIAILFKGMG